MTVSRQPHLIAMKHRCHPRGKQESEVVQCGTCGAWWKKMWKKMRTGKGEHIGWVKA